MKKIFTNKKLLLVFNLAYLVAVPLTFAAVMNIDERTKDYVKVSLAEKSEVDEENVFLSFNSDSPSVMFLEVNYEGEVYPILPVSNFEKRLIHDFVIPKHFMNDGDIYLVTDDRQVKVQELIK